MVDPDACAVADCHGIIVNCRKAEVTDNDVGLVEDVETRSSDLSTLANANQRLVRPNLDSRGEVEVTLGVNHKRLCAGDCFNELSDGFHSDAFAVPGMSASGGTDRVIFCESDQAKIETCWRRRRGERERNEGENRELHFGLHKMLIRRCERV